MCNNYPSADNNFNVGSVIRNYHLWDGDDNEMDICEFADAGGRYLFLTIGASW